MKPKIVKNEKKNKNEQPCRITRKLFFFYHILKPMKLPKQTNLTNSLQY